LRSDAPHDRRQNISSHRSSTEQTDKFFILRSRQISWHDQTGFGAIFMALPPFKQSQLGKILLGVSIFFVVLFAVTLIMNWISNPDMFKPVFGG